jgi:hypothetical protein
VECEWNCKAAGILFFCLHPFAHLVIFPRRLLHPSIEDGVSYSLVLGRVITDFISSLSPPQGMDCISCEEKNAV